MTMAASGPTPVFGFGRSGVPGGGASSVDELEVGGRFDFVIQLRNGNRNIKIVRACVTTPSDGSAII